MKPIVNHANYYDRHVIVSKHIDDDEEVVMVHHPNDNPLIGEVNILPSRTIPGMVTTLREMVEKYAQGGSVEVFKPVYTDDELIPDNWERWDEVERLDYARALREHLFTQAKHAQSEAQATYDFMQAQKAEPETPAEVIDEPPKPSKKGSDPS